MSKPTIPSVDWETTKLKKTNFDKLVLQRIKLATEEREAKRRKDEISEEIEILMTQAKVKKVKFYETTVRLGTGVNKWIDPTLLFEEGVNVDIIEKCTKEKEYTYIDIREASMGEGDEPEGNGRGNIEAGKGKGGKVPTRR